MSEKMFSGTEIVTGIAFTVVSALIGIGAYQIGFHNLSRADHSSGGAEMIAAPKEAPINGQSLYMGNCAGCHGAKAEGAVGPALKASSGWTNEQFAEAVLHGKAPTRELSAVMPRFETSGLDGAPATPEQLKAIQEYLAGQ